MLMRVVVGLLVSRRRVGALSDSTGVVEVRGCTGLEPSSQLAFVSEDGNARLFIDAVQSVAIFCPCCKSDSIKLPLHLLGNDGGKRRARSCERSVVLRGATSSTRSWARSGVARGFGSGLLIRKPLRAVVRVGFGVV